METKKKAFRNAVQSFEGVLRSQHRVYDGSGEVARTQDVWGAEGISAVALSFCRLLGLGCPKQAFAKIATPRVTKYYIFKDLYFVT
ncbi:hypothetical protein BMR06_00435 [Methylococcaceae bacterium HT5]|nr:hypothetical protein BMR06_00435 [Methylococcaceae bacterium HT5]